MAELQDTDLMLVNRGGKSYKATGAEIKDSLNPSVVTKPQIIAPAEGAGIAIGAESDEIIGVIDDKKFTADPYQTSTSTSNLTFSNSNFTVEKTSTGGNPYNYAQFEIKSGNVYTFTAFQSHKDYAG